MHIQTKYIHIHIHIHVHIHIHMHIHIHIRIHIHIQMHIRIHCGKDPQREGSEALSVLSWASFPFQLSDLASGSENCIGPKSMCEVGFLGFAMTMYCWMGVNRLAFFLVSFSFSTSCTGRGFQNIEQA